MECPPTGTFDLALLLDTHSGMGDSNLELTRSFAKAIVEQFEVGSDKAKVTVAGYSGEKVTPSTFLLDSNTNTKEQMLSTMSNIQFSGESFLCSTDFHVSKSNDEITQMKVKFSILRHENTFDCEVENNGAVSL